MPNLPNPAGEAPVCPMCDGPCTKEFERSPYSIPDRLPRAQDGTADPPPAPKAPKPNLRGKRAHKPSDDRMHRPSEDRSA